MWQITTIKNYRTNELISNEVIVNDYLTSNTCTCGVTTTKDNVNPMLQSYLYPKKIIYSTILQGFFLNYFVLYVGMKEMALMIG